MLKGKKSIYILLPLTLLVWGYISFQVYKTFNSDDPEEMSMTSVLPVSSDKPFQDTFSIFNNYRDPFLGESGKELNVENTSYNRNPQINRNANVSNNRNPVNQNVKAPVVSDWPQITYSGIIKNQTTSKAVAVVVIGGRTYTLKQGEERDGIKLLSFNSEEVQLVRGKEKKIVRK